ncbi:hypothetical protein BKA69DRAFT_304954 [Paraphysoderma sedebokerense]|nr:hypothetical protein BKA69DRAFT_304954 [Paraphysoderma sedebokerense]
MEQFHLQQQDFLPSLETLKSKIEQLVIALKQFDAMHGRMSWPEMLSTYNLIVAKFVNIQQDLNPALLRNILLQPYNPPPANSEFIPRVLLRTKLIPSIESHISQIESETLNLVRQQIQSSPELQNVVDAASTESTTGIGGMGFKKGKKRRKYDDVDDETLGSVVKHQIQKHDSLVNSFYDKFKEIKSDYDLKTRYESESDDEEDEDESDEDVEMEDANQPQKKQKEDRKEAKEEVKVVPETVLKKELEDTMKLLSRGRDLGT